MFEFLGFEDSEGNKYPPDQPPEWMVQKISDAFIEIFEAPAGNNLRHLDSGQVAHPPNVKDREKSNLNSDA